MSLQHCSFCRRQLKLHPVSRRHVQCKHLISVHLRRTDRLVSHRALQYLKWNTAYNTCASRRNVGMCVGLPARRKSPRHPVTLSAAANATALLIQVGTVRSVISQMCAFSVIPVRLLHRSSGSFRMATIIPSWLTYCGSESGTSW